MLFINQLLEQPSLLAYFTGADNYAWLQFRNGERRLLAKPLIYFEQRLPAFIRIHKTALVNPACVVSFQHPPRPKMAGSVQVEDGSELPVSRRRWPDVLKLLKTDSEQLESANGADLNQSSRDLAPQYAPGSVYVQTIMTGDTLLLTQHCIDELGLPCRLQSTQYGAELASALLLSDPEEWPILILIDSRTNRADRILALQTLKAHPRLRAIPVIWLATSVNDTIQAYLLDANSVVIVPDDPTALVKAIKELLTYWLTVVQLAT